MANHPNPLRRYLFRLDFLQKVQSKLNRQLRAYRKNSFRDQQKLFQDYQQLCIFDIGAKWGTITEKYLKLFPQANIYAFEPYSVSFNRLKANFQNHSSVLLFPYGLSDEENLRDLFVSTSSGMNSIYNPVKSREWGFTNNLKTESVTLRKLDDVCQENHISNIHIMKLDVQGSEIDVLSGGINLLLSDKIDLIYVEIQITPFYENQPLFYDLYSFLNKYGYSLFNMYDLKDSKIGQLRWADAIFISHTFRESLKSRFGENSGWYV